jgi:hypothetical protein
MIASRYSYQAEFRRLVSHFTVVGAAALVILAIAATSSGNDSTAVGFRGAVDFCDGRSFSQPIRAIDEATSRLRAPTTPCGKTATSENPVDFCEGSERDADGRRSID